MKNKIKVIDTYIIKTFSQDDLYYIIPESLEEKFDEFEEKLEGIAETYDIYDYGRCFDEEDILVEFATLFDEYSCENLSTIKIKGVIENE
jgi:hypothetical protein